MKIGDTRSSKPQEIQLQQKASDIVSDVTDNPPVVSRMENRSFPSVFQAWDDLIGSIGNEQTPEKYRVLGQ